MTHILKLYKNDTYSQKEINYLLDENLLRCKDIKILADSLCDSLDKHSIYKNDILKIYCSLSTNCMALQTLQNLCKANNIFLIINVESKTKKGKEVYAMDITQDIKVHPNLVNKINKHIKLLGGT